MAMSARQVNSRETAFADRAAAGPSPALGRSLQLLDRAAARIEQQRHQLAALQERATRAETIAAAALKELEPLKSQLAQAHDEIALQRDRIGTMQAQADATHDTTLAMILDLRERLVAAERPNSLGDASFTAGGRDGRTPHRARPN